MSGDKTAQERHNEALAAMFGALVGALVALPALLLGAALSLVVPGRRRVFALGCVLCVGWCTLVWGAWAGHVQAGFRAATGSELRVVPELPDSQAQERRERAKRRRARRRAARADRRAAKHRRARERRRRARARPSLARAWPHVRAWWLLGLPLCIPVALVVHLVCPKGVAELEAERERAARRRYRRQRRRAARRATTLAGRPQRLTRSRGPLGPRLELVALGAFIEGERFLAQSHGRVAMPLEWLRRHALVIGPSGSGKTETLLRLAHGAALHGWPVYYLDAKGDPAGAARFRGVMAAAGRAAASFPDVAFDCWRGDSRAIYNRLLELVPFSKEGDGSWYRDIAKQVLWAACDHPGGPPRSSRELLERLAPAELRAHDPTGMLAGFDTQALAGPRARYGAFFNALDGRLDGNTSFEDLDSAYLLLDGLRLKEETDTLARLLIEDFADYAAKRKPRQQQALLIVDEFSAIAQAARVVELVERVRSYNVAVVLAPQVEEGIDRDHNEGARIVQNVETVFCHALKRPESIAALAGTRREIEWSHQHQDTHTTGLGTGRAQHTYKVDPNKVRALQPGECYLIRKGQAAAIKIAQVPGAAVSAVPRPREAGRGPSLHTDWGDRVDQPPELAP